MENIREKEIMKMDVQDSPNTIAAIFIGINSKIREDLIRFRTCCADPRGSK